jgi:hypothetical protein
MGSYRTLIIRKQKPVAFIYGINKKEPIYQNHVVYNDDPPDGDCMVRVGERVEQALLPLQAVEYLLANFGTRLDKKK